MSAIFPPNSRVGLQLGLGSPAKEPKLAAPYGWRRGYVDPLNGVNLMPADIFVCVSRYTVPFAERESFEDGEAAATTTFHTNMGGGGFLGFDAAASGPCGI